jgi:hypothetical protein
MQTSHRDTLADPTISCTNQEEGQSGELTENPSYQ